MKLQTDTMPGNEGKKVMMTRQHYEIVANIIHDLPPTLQGDMANHFADRLEATNPRFDRAKFVAWCMNGGSNGTS